MLSKLLACSQVFPLDSHLFLPEFEVLVAELIRM